MKRRPAVRGVALIGGMSVLLLVIGRAVWGGAAEPEKGLPAKVTCRVLKDLERELSQVEAVAEKLAGAKKELVKNVTLRLQNYLDDVKLSSGKYATIYPRAMLEVLREEMDKPNSKRDKIAELLVDYEKKDKFKDVKVKGGN